MTDPLQIEDSGATPTLRMYAGEPAAAPDVYALGYEPNGHFWEAVAKILVATQAPGLAGTVSYGSDGDTFLAHSDSRADLELLSALMSGPVSDPDRLRDVVDAADAAGIDISD